MFECDRSQFARVDELHLPLINRFYNECKYKVKCGRQDRVYSLAVDGQLVAAARLILQSSCCYLLRNLCVSPEFRNRGLASYFVQKILCDIAPQDCYCYALPHLKNFYLALGFLHLTADQVPGDIGEVHLRNRLRNRDWLLMGFRSPQSAGAL